MVWVDFLHCFILISFVRLSSLDKYYIPRDGTLESYHDYIQILPNIDHPEVFGQHTNADIVTQITENAAMFKTMSSIQKQATSTTEMSAEDRVRTMIFFFLLVPFLIQFSTDWSCRLSF